MQVHQRKGHLKLLRALTRQGKNCECHSAHSCLFINILGSGSYMLLFHQPTRHNIYCIW